MQIYKIKNQQTIYDVAILLYGDVSFVFKLMQDNPAITSLNFDFLAYSGMDILYDPSIKKPPSQQAVQKTHTIRVTNGQDGKFRAVETQSIYDVCLMTYGTLDLLQKLITDNNIGNSNSVDIAGKLFKFDKTLIRDVQFYNHLQDTGYIIATVAPPFGTDRRAHDLSFNISFD